MIKPGNYYFSPSAISLTLNAASGAFTASETVMASAVAGAVMKVASRLVTSRERVLVLGYGAQLQHRQFNMALHNTVLGYPGNKFADDDIYVYMRLDASNNGSTGEMVFLPYELDYDGTILTNGTPKVYESIEYGSRTEGEDVIYFLLNENTENVSELTYYYIHIATIAAPQGGKRTWKESLQCGQLDTAKGNDEKSDSTLEKMFKLVNNVIHVLLPLDKLTFQKSGTEAYIDHILTLTVSSAETAMEWISDTAVATTASIASFVSEKIGELDSRFFRKDTDDASPFSATFGALSTAKMKQPDGSVSDGSFSSDGKTDLATSGEDTSIGGNLDVKGDADVEGALHVKKDLSIDKNIFVGGNVGSELKPILLAFINFLKSDNYKNENLFGEGFMLTNDNGNGQSSLVVDNILVRMKAIFNELEIRKISYAGGNIIFSHAGSRISLVKPIYKKIASVNGSSVVLVNLASVDGTTMKMEGESYLNGTTLNIDTSGEEILSYRCYIKKDDGTTETKNWWKIDDQAKCQTFNIEEGTHYNAENTYYWRRVVGIGSEKPDGSDEIYDFVDLSAADCDGGSDEPKEGDSIVQMGNRTDTSRQGFISIEVYSEDGSAPSFKVYKNVSDYSLVDKQRIVLSPKETSLVVNKFSIETNYDVQRVPMFRGDWADIEDRRCYYYDVVMHNGSTWLCVYPESGTNGTTEEPSETSSYWKVYAKQGATGRGILSVQEYYLATDKSEGVTNEDEGFTTEVQSTTAEKPYLWNYELTILTDNTYSKTDAQMVGMYTEDGNGIHSIVNYYLSTNKADGITTGTAGWTTSVQSIDADKPYLWNYEKITYTKGEPTKTDPHIIGFFGTSAAMLVCTPSLISIPTDTDGRVLEDYEQEISLSLYAGGKKISISAFSVNESGYSKYIAQEGALSINSATLGGATVTGSNLTLGGSLQKVEGTRLVFQDGVVKITQASVDSAVVKVYKDAILTEKDAQIYAYGYNDGGFKYEGYADIRIQRQYVAKDGEDGKNGEDGLDGDDGISMYLDNTAVLFTQDVKDANVITPSSVDVNVNVVMGKTPVTTGVSVFLLSAENFNKTGVKIDGTKITLSANGIQTYQEDEKSYFCEQGSVTFTVIYRGLISTLTLRWLLNAIGKFKTTVEGDVETSIASKLVHGVNDGKVQTIEQVGEYIRSSSEAVTTLSKTVDGVVKSVTELEITADGLTARVEDNEDNYSRISQRVDNIALKVGTSPNLFYNAFFDRNLTEVLGGTLPDAAVGLRADDNALYGKRVLSFGYGYFAGNHRTGFMGADTKGYGVFLREGTYTFKVRARVTNSYTQGDAGIILAWDDTPNMETYSSSKILQKISLSDTSYNVYSYNFTLTTGRYVAFYLYFADVSVGGEGLQILVDAVSLKNGNGDEGFDAGNDSSSAGEAVGTMGEMLYDTGIDIERRKITFTADNFVYRNNKGETTALLDESGNMTIAGVYNNEVNDITEDNASNYGYYLLASKIFFLDPLKCPAVVRINIANLSKIILPIAYNGNEPPALTTYIEGSKAGESKVHHTLEEMRQCIGKKIWLIRGEQLQGVNFALQTGGHEDSYSPNLLMHVSDNMGDFADVKGAVNLVESATIGHTITGSDYAYRNYVLECKMGIYNGYECIYWEVRVSGIRLT